MFDTFVAGPTRPQMGSTPFAPPSKGFAHVGAGDARRLGRESTANARRPTSLTVGAERGLADEGAKAYKAWSNVLSVDGSWRTHTQARATVGHEQKACRVARDEPSYVLDEPSYVLRGCPMSLGGLTAGKTTRATMGPAAWEKANNDFGSATLQDWLAPLRTHAYGMEKGFAQSVKPRDMFSPFDIDDKLCKEMGGPPGLREEGLTMGRDPGDEQQQVTTVMLRNIACRYSQEDIATALDDVGLAWTYELVYIPRSPTRKSNLGYAFVYFREPRFVAECIRLCDGRPFGRCSTTKLCKVALAHVQGEQGLLPRPGKKKNSRKHGQAPLFAL